MTQIYNSGTVTVTNGSAAVVGIGTAWSIALVTGGTLNIEAPGNPMPIDAVTDDTHLSGAVKWTGASGTYSYAIVRESSDAANVVDLQTTISRVLVTLSLVGIHPNASGTIAKRDAIVLTTDDEGFLFLHAEPGLPFLFYRWNGTAWDGPFDTRGLAGVGSGGLGLPSPGAANKFPYYTGANTVVLGDLTVAGRAILDDTDASAQLTTLGFSAFAKTLIDDANASAVLSTLGFSTFAKTIIDDADAAAVRGTIGLGSAAVANIGTSGATVPLLNGNNTYSGAASFTGGLSVAGTPQVTARRTGLGGGAPVATGGTDANQFLVAGNENVDWRFGFYTNGTMWSQPSLINSYNLNFGTVLCPNGGNIGIGNMGTLGNIPSKLSVAGAFATAAPGAPKTANYTMVADEDFLIFNGAGTLTLTLLAAASYPGQWLLVKTIAAQAVNSASSNVKPKASNTAGTAILPATAGAWALLRSDGVSAWVVAMSGT